MSTKALNTDRIAQALGHIAASNGVAALERAFLHVAPGLVETSVYGMYMVDPAGRTTSVRTAEVPQGFLEAYEEFGRSNDSLFRHIVAHRVPTHDRALFAPSAWAEEPVGRFLADWGFGHAIQAPVCIDGVVEATLHFARMKPTEPFRPPDLGLAALLARQVAQQLRWIRVEQSVGRMRGLCTSLLEQIQVPAVVTTEVGGLAEANQAAEAMLLSYRASPQLWGEYARAVRHNVDAIVANGNDAGGTATSRDGVDEITYRVRTTPVERTGMLLSLFHPSTDASTGQSTLAAREQVIASLVAKGHTNCDIATALDLSVNTVKDHLKRINRKLGTSNRAQVAAWAQRNLSPASTADPTVSDSAGGALPGTG